MNGKTKILVGILGAAQGIRGEVRIKSYTGEALAIGRYGMLSTDDGRRSFDIVNLRLLRDDMVVAKLRGIDDRTAAAALTGVRLFADRSRLPPLADGEIYHADLIGLVASTPDAQRVGEVIGVENYGAGDLLEIDRGTGDTVLVPFTLSFVPEIDLGAGRITIEPGAMGGADDRPDAEVEP